MIALAAALSACLAWWALDRRLVALDAPISVSSGRYQSAEFRLDPDFIYYIQIEVDGGYPVSEKLECVMWGCGGTSSLLRMKWAQFGNGSPEASGASDSINGGSGDLNHVGRIIGAFKSSDGRYQLAIDVVSDLSTLNTRHPRVRVEADGEAYNRRHIMVFRLLWVSGVLTALGVALCAIGRDRHKLISLGISNSAS